MFENTQTRNAYELLELIRFDKTYSMFNSDFVVISIPPIKVKISTKKHKIQYYNVENLNLFVNKFLEESNNSADLR